LLSARRSALIPLVALGFGLLTSPPASAAVPRLANETALGPAPQAAPAQVTDLAGAGQTQVYGVRRAPGDISITMNFGGTFHRVDGRGLVKGASVVGDVAYLPSPGKVTVHDKSGLLGSIAVGPEDRYLTGAGDHEVLLATSTSAGTSLTLRPLSGPDRLVTTLPAGSIGHVAADPTTALVAYTADGSTVPVVDALDLASGTVTQVNTTALTVADPLVALSPGVYGWSDSHAVVRAPRTGGAELRRTTGPVTALAINDDSTGWTADGRFSTAVLDDTVAPVDHGPVLDPTLAAATLSSYHVPTAFSGLAFLDEFVTSKVAAPTGDNLGRANAVISDLRLTAGLLVSHDNSNPKGTLTSITRRSQGDIAVEASRYASSDGGRRLMAVSGRFQALGNAADTSVTMTVQKAFSSDPDGATLTAPIATGVDTIELSGMRLLVHRPGANNSQLYTNDGHNTPPLTLPLTSSLYGARVAWLNPDGSVQTEDLDSGTTTTIRPATALTCPASATAIRVAGDSVFWSLCGHNRVHHVSSATDIVLPDGDDTNARLGTGVLAVQDPATGLLSVTDLDTLTSYPVADTPVSFDVDERFVAWADDAYAVHIAPLPFDNSDVGPQVLARWVTNDTVIPRGYTYNRVPVKWERQIDFSQPVNTVLAVGGFNRRWSGPQTNAWLQGSMTVEWDGSTSDINGDHDTPPGLYPWTVTATAVSGSTVQWTQSGTLAVRDPRGTRVVITSSPKTLIAGGRGAINLKVLLGSNGIPGAPLTVQARLHGTTAWQTIASLKASSTGTLSYAVAPSQSSDYLIRYSGGPYGPATSVSPIIAVGVAQKVTAAFSRSSVRTGTTVTLSGAVAPAKAGQLVSVQRYSSGKWRTTANMKLSSTSSYRLSLRATRGSVSYRVVRATDSRNLAGTSPTLVLKGS
jgi:hypothetical protein